VQELLANHLFNLKLIFFWEGLTAVVEEAGGFGDVYRR
jgi:hypothetical protein